MNTTILNINIHDIGIQTGIVYEETFCIFSNFKQAWIYQISRDILSNFIAVLILQIIMKTANNRFNVFTNDSEVSNMIKSSIPESTRKKSKWAIKVLNDYNNARNQSILNNSSNELMVLNEYQDFTKGDLMFLLPKFIIDVRKEDGTQYPSESLRQLICAIFHYYRYEEEKAWDFFRDPDFSESRKSLDSTMRKVTKEGVGLQKRKAEFISIELEEQLWIDGHLGVEKPEQLLRTILYLIGLHFGLRARKEHRQLRFGENSQFTLYTDRVTKNDVLRYTENCQKTRNGGLYERNIEPKIVERFETEEPYNIVKIFKIYCDHRPKHGKNVSNFYLQALEQPKGHIWYKDQPVGENKIGKMTKELFEGAGIDGHFTNHSLRRSKVTRMFQAGAQKDEVKKESGHRSDNGVFGYREFSRTEKIGFQMMLEPKRNDQGMTSTMMNDEQSSMVPAASKEPVMEDVEMNGGENQNKVRIIVKNADKSVIIEL